MSTLRRTRSLTASALLGLTLAVVGASSLPAAVADDSIVTTADGAQYRGALRNGRFEGRGSLHWDNGAKYEGDFENGLMSGRGRLSAPGGTIYEGTFRNGALNGEGTLKTPDGTVQEGWFRNGLLQGQGRSSGPDGEYQGGFSDGRFSGRGELRLPGGETYRGEFHLGRLHGMGRYETSSGDSYEGEFRLDQFSGRGVYQRGDGTRHEGQFEHWQPQGKGRLVDAAGSIFEGQFEKGELSGEGRIVHKNFSDYSGEIREWLPHGQGTLRMASGDVYVGGFARGVFDGEGTLTYARERDGTSSVSGRWRGGELLDGDNPAGTRRPAATPDQLESALYSEPERLSQALDGLKPGDPEAIDMYLLSLAGDGQQEVFRRESEFVRAQFDRDFGTRGRSMMLVNSRSTLGTTPMASVTSLRRALQTIGSRMNREQDILFLYLTSHGSPQHELSLAQSNFDLPDLSATQLSSLLEASGIRWRVVVVSACYSGGFIDALRDPNTLVITAARHDRRSFGCADENDFTYFGRAFFKDALPHSNSFEDAFNRSTALIREREMALLSESGKVNEDDFSLPQIDAPAEISARLQRWWASRSALARN